MNRRQFLQRFAAAPIAAVLAEPVARTIFLPPSGGWPDPRVLGQRYAELLAESLTRVQPLSNTLATPVELSEASLERMLAAIWAVPGPPFSIRPNRLIVSPQIKQQIDEDPVLQKYVREMFG
jgi:hypothetical protein